MRTLGALLYLFAAGLLAVLWARGYLTAAIAKVTAGVQSPPAPRPFAIAAGSSGPTRVRIAQ
jgi:hypothetical protein